MRNPLPANADNESLQTDVMRFMAIIAFCLIAILALVKSSDGDVGAASVGAASAANAPVGAASVGAALAANASASKPTQTSQSKNPVGAASAANADASTDDSRLKPLPQQTEVDRSRPDHSRLKPLPQQADVDPSRANDSRLKPLPQQAEVDRSRPDHSRLKPLPQHDMQDPGNDEGLTLRFASDGDFLRLISRGDVTVFAYRGDAVWALGRDYVFRSARAPRRIYELELDTIPHLVNAAFVREHAAPDAFTWGVSLPRRIESQIQSYVGRVDHGALLIDRFGEVRHVGTS